MDNLTKKQRRKTMQAIRSKGTTPERLIMHELKRRKIYFASHVASIIGKPDIVFRRKKVAVFVDSVFWHGHPKKFILPQSNIAYWKIKIERNKKRDRKVSAQLKTNGWQVVRIWDCEIKKNLEKSVNKIFNKLDLIVKQKSIPKK